MTAPKRRPPAPVDVHVGKRIKLRRTLLCISQQKLADALGLTFQQVQKYEASTNRVSCSKLYEIAKVLDVEIAFFFEGLEPTTAEPAPLQDPMHSEVGMRLVNLATRRLSAVGVGHLLGFLEGLPARKADLGPITLAAE